MKILASYPTAINCSNNSIQIENKGKKKRLSTTINCKGDTGNNTITNMNNSAKNIISFNNNIKNIKKFYGINNKIDNFPRINLRNSINAVLGKYKSKDINNDNDIYQNPPSKKKHGYLNNIKGNNRYKDQNQSLDRSTSDNKSSIHKNQLRNSLKDSNLKSKLFFKSTDANGGKKNKLISNNLISINIKNEESASKRRLLQNISIFNKFAKKNAVEKPKHDEKKIIQKNLKFIDAELNKMDYQTALIYDQRNYLQYYMSLLKKKHLIVLVFVSNDDYNVFFLKLSLFILSISLYFAINTLFFRDSTMKYIFVNEGKYDFLYQIPQVLYSTMISSTITFILKNLSLSQNDIIDLKRESDKKKAKKKGNEVKKRLKIKLYIFLFVGLALLLFCWYYITAFCAVYPNTQIHLINDSLISFGISMLYPFIINLLPGFLRIPSLKAVKKDKECMYKTSQIIGML